MASVWITGMLTGLALIVAIGAQNAFVLRQGIRRAHVGAVVAICIASDAVLITAGTAGIGFLVEKVPWLLELLRWGGVAYLVLFAVQSFRSAANTGGLAASSEGGGGLRSVVATTLALTWLNPHVYLDTVLMLGNLANQHGAQRWIFAFGAVVASVVWFTALGLGARGLSRVLNTPTTWRIVDVGVGVVMLGIALKLALSPVF